MKGEVCPDEAKSAPSGPCKTVSPPQSGPYGQDSGSWFIYPAQSAIIAHGMSGHLGKIG